MKPTTVKGWFRVENVFVNYFWLYFVSGVIFTLVNKNWLFTFGWPVVLLIMCGRNKLSIKLNIIDLLWILEFCWIILTWLINSFPNKPYIILRCVGNDIAFMFAYWISRRSRKDYLHLIYSNSFKPLLLACIIGLYCYFLRPDWYMTKTVEYLAGVFDDYQNTLTSLEFFRLRSVFPSTYSMAYFCAIIIIGEFFFLFNTSKSDNKYYGYHWAFLSIMVLCSLFCMMRGPIVGALLGGGYAVAYSILYTRGARGLRTLLSLALVAVVGVVIISQYVDLEILDFLVSKFDEVSGKGSSFIEDRLLLQRGEGKALLIGDGYGRYGEVALQLGMRGIPDSEYTKILEEQGIIGLVLTASMFSIGLIKACRHFKCLYYELALLTMLLICMIGADPLTIADKHCFIYWLALGQASRFVSIKQTCKIER